MGRKKKQQTSDQGSTLSILSGDVKRSVVAIALFTLAILFVLGFFGNSGVLGKLFNEVIGMLLGWGKWFTPIVLICAGVILLFRKETLFYVSKLIGLSVAFVGLLGFLHIFFEKADMIAKAKAGVGGGYVGYIFDVALIKLFGTIGAGVILFALIAMGIFVAFNFSIITLLRKLYREKISEGDSCDEEQAEEDEEKIEKEEIPEKKIEYVGDSDQEDEDESENRKKQKRESVLQKVSDWMPKKSKKDESDEEEEERDEYGHEWELPPISLLEKTSGRAESGDTQKNQKKIQDTFHHFGIEVENDEIKVGPTVTQYSFKPAVGVKLSRITSLNDDLALALASHPIRIEAPIPGKSLIGIEVKNKSVAQVRLPELLNSSEFIDNQSNLTIALGKDVSGNYIVGDLKKMPHLMIAGMTGSGKSVCANTILLSLLYQNSPDDLKLILVDPKRVELSLYNGIPHLLADVIVENGKVVSALKWAIGEMERRYKLLQSTGSRDITSYNQKAQAGETRTVVDQDTGEVNEEEIEKIPYIVIMIDELADLMATHGKEVEGAIIRLAQMARAVGIHLIVSTQRPSVEVITGLIKANIATRIAFKVATQIDSRTILDASGAEKLLGNGDMLYSSTAVGGMRRLQGVYVNESEVKRVVDFIIKQKNKIPQGLDDQIVESSKRSDSLERNNFGHLNLDSNESEEEDDDPLYEEAKRTVLETRKASTSFLQRKFRIGYSRAARLIDLLEDRGIVGPQDGSRPREVYANGEDDPDYEDGIEDQQKRDKWQM